MKRILLLVLICGSFATVQAQQVGQYSQYMFNSLYINPAYAGYRGPTHLHTYYRSQWTDMDGGPRTFALAADMRTKSDRVGLGLNLVNDKIGLEKRLYAYANYAYRLRLSDNPEERLSFGIGVGLIHSAFDNTGIITESPEAVYIENTTLPDARFGIHYSNDDFFVGIGMDNLISRLVFNSGNTVNKFPPVTQYYFNAGGIVKLDSDFLLKPTLLVKNADNAAYRAWTADINAALMMVDKLTIGATYRTALFNDQDLVIDLPSPNSIIALAEFIVTENIHIGYTFDYSLNKIGNLVGNTHEISLGYKFRWREGRMRTPKYF